MALYFAVMRDSSEMDEESEVDACLWVLDPSKLNHLNDESFPYISKSANDEHFIERYKKVIAIHAPYMDLRMKMQQSVFTVHGHHRTLQEERGVNLFLIKKIVIPYELKIDIQKCLSAFGVTRATLFPDMGSIAKTIREDVFG